VQRRALEQAVNKLWKLAGALILCGCARLFAGLGQALPGRAGGGFEERNRKTGQYYILCFRLALFYHYNCGNCRWPVAAI